MQVYLTQSLPDNSGLRLKRVLDAAGIPNTLILDGAVGYVMERVDCVLLGAEGLLRRSQLRPLHEEGLH